MFAIERYINGLSAAERLAVHQERSKPLLNDMEEWLHAERAGLSRRNTTALRLPNRQTGVFLDGGTKTRFSIVCSGFVKARAIRIMARVPGEEAFTPFGLPKRVTVE